MVKLDFLSRTRALLTKLWAVGTDRMSRRVVVMSGTCPAAPDVPCEAVAACGSLAASCVTVSGQPGLCKDSEDL